MWAIQLLVLYLLYTSILATRLLKDIFVYKSIDLMCWVICFDMLTAFHIVPLPVLKHSLFIFVILRVMAFELTDVVKYLHTKK